MEHQIHQAVAYLGGARGEIAPGSTFFEAAYIYIINWEL